MCYHKKPLIAQGEKVNISIPRMDSIPTKHTISSTWCGAEPTLGDNCILVVEGKEVACCESPPLKRLTEQSSLKCSGGALKHAQREGGAEKQKETERRGENSSRVLRIICIFLKALSPCCLAIVLSGYNVTRRS